VASTAHAPWRHRTSDRTAATMATSSYCDPVSQCKVEVKASGATPSGGAVYSGKKTSGSCGAGDPDLPSSADTTDQESCTGSTPPFCMTAGDGAYVDDNFFKPKDVPDNGCLKFASGGKVCDGGGGPTGPSAASTPPVPDNGTPGHPAPPDQVVQAKITKTGGITSTTTTNTYNYYKCKRKIKSRLYRKRKDILF